MEREIEVKILHVDLKAMEEKLIREGAVKIGEEHQTNYLIDSPSWPIPAELGYMRIRRIKKDDEEEIQCTFK